MGTNLYLHGPACKACARDLTEPLHIGKRSAGWVFALHLRSPDELFPYEGNVPATLAEWVELFETEGFTIVDEYGVNWTPAAALLVINDGVGKRSTPDSNHRVDPELPYDETYGVFS